MSARVMVVGGGSARDHALVRALRRSPEVGRLLFVPGNSAVEHLEGVESAPVATQDLDGLVELAEMEEIDLTVVGPNTPVVMGLVDRFAAHDLPIFGPGRAAARLEGSKAFAKNFMIRHQIPTARFAVFESTERADHFCKTQRWARVIKTDGLAYERGVEVCEDYPGCAKAIERIMIDEVLDADVPARVVVEERLVGSEITLCVLSDGHDALVLDANLNYPRIGEGNTGMRTRGMGAVSPAPGVDDALRRRLEDEIARPAIRGIADLGRPLVGALFIDVIVQNGAPYVLDFNVRFGDPATQVLIARLRTDLFGLMKACVQGDLARHRAALVLDPRVAVSVVVATGGYPQTRRREDVVTLAPGIDTASRHLDVGAMRHTRDRLLTTGGRVATVTALGDSLEEATRSAYEGARGVRFDGAHLRRDIGSGEPTEP